MRLYGSPTSPFARMVSVALRETGLTEQVEEVSVSGGPADPGTHPLASNPLGKIPTLEREDGCALYDSRVILRYIDVISDGRLYPKPPRLWETLTLETTAQGVAEAALLIVYETRMRSPEARSETWVEAQWTKVARSLDAIEARWMSHLAGSPDAAQIAVGCALGYLDLRHPERDWRAGRPSLAGWEARFAERPAMVATRPPKV